MVPIKMKKAGRTRCWWTKWEKKKASVQVKIHLNSQSFQTALPLLFFLLSQKLLLLFCCPSLQEQTCPKLHPDRSRGWTWELNRASLPLPSLPSALPTDTADLWAAEGLSHHLFLSQSASSPSPAHESTPLSSFNASLSAEKHCLYSSG